MNINGFSSRISQAHSIGSRLDVTLSEPATPHRSSSVQSTSATPQVGSIPGVLTDAENLAIASAFRNTSAGTYTMGGTTRTAPATPGIHLDLQA